MNAYKELSKYFYKDISDIITEYMEENKNKSILK
jgi:hypothetical protein